MALKEYNIEASWDDEVLILVSVNREEEEKVQKE